MTAFVYFPRNCDVRVKTVLTKVVDVCVCVVSLLLWFKPTGQLRIFLFYKPSCHLMLINELD